MFDLSINKQRPNLCLRDRNYSTIFATRQSYFLSLKKVMEIRRDDSSSRFSSELVVDVVANKAKHGATPRFACPRQVKHA